MHSNTKEIGEGDVPSARDAGGARTLTTDLTDNLPTGNIVSRIGSKADGKLSFDYSIPQPGDVVKKYLKDDIPDEAAPVLFKK